MTIALLGINLAKNMFSLHGLDEASQSAPVLEAWISDSVPNVEEGMNGR